MIVIAALVGGYILAHENLKLPGWVPVLGRSYFMLERRISDRAGGHARAGPGGHDRGREDRRNRERGPAQRRRDRDDEPDAEIRRAASTTTRRCCCARRPQLKDMTVEVDPGSPGKRTAAQRRDHPAVADRAGRQLRRIPRGPRRRNARLPAGAARGRRRRPEEQRQGLSATLKRFDPTARDAQLITQQLRYRHANIAHAIHNFKLLMEAFGNKDTAAGRPDPGLQRRVPDVRAGEPERSTHDAAAARRAEQDRTGARQARDRVQRRRADAHETPAVRQCAGARRRKRRARRSRRRTPIFKNEIRPFAREILPTVNALEPT